MGCGMFHAPFLEGMRTRVEQAAWLSMVVEYSCGTAPDSQE
jgi:hypothetical protein